MFGILNGMQGEGGTALSKLAAAVREFRARDERVDLKELRGVIDELEGEFSIEARLAQKAGDHLIGGNIYPASLIAPRSPQSVSPPPPQLFVRRNQHTLPPNAP